jgi:hypothetical protein
VGVVGVTTAGSDTIVADLDGDGRDEVLNTENLAAGC